MGWRRAQPFVSQGRGQLHACRDLTSDGIQAHQLKRTFIRRTFFSIHFNENLAAIRH